MVFKHYDVVRAASPSDLADALAQKIREGWQPYGGPFSSYTDDGAALIQAIVAEGDVSTPVVVKPSDGEGTVISATRDPEYYFVVVLAGQSNSMAYGEGLPLPETYDRPDPRIKQLARRSTVTPGGAACKYNDIIPADHCLHDVQDMSRLNHPKADLSKGAVRNRGARAAYRQKIAAVYTGECGHSAGSVLSWWFSVHHRSRWHIQ
ncbi:PF08410 domain protein [Escherichia coli 5.0959]|nr:PF08410 domain protein [Escherichia coli 5.0959]